MNIASIEITEADRFASVYYQSLIAGFVKKAAPFPGDQLRGWATLFKQAYDVYQIDLELLGELVSEDVELEHYKSAAQSAHSSFEALRRMHPRLDELIRSIDIGIGDDEKEGADALAPPLPALASLDYGQGKEYRQWLDAWIDYAMEVFPAAERVHVEATGIWLLSAIIARRIAIVKVLPAPLYTILYIALASRSSVGKSMLVELGLALLEEVGLKDKLTFEGDLSPQLITRRASGKVDEAYSSMPEDKREEELISMLFAGYQGWYFDELGKVIQRLNSPAGGPQASRLVELLLTWYSGKGQSRGSLTHGMDRVKEVYMPVIGCMTLTNMQQMQKLGTSFWGDGFLARMIPATSPVRQWKDVDLKRGRPDFPPSLTEPLERLNGWLTEPDARIVEQPGGVKGSVYRLEREPLPVHYRSLDKQTFMAYQNYFNATGRMHMSPDVPEEISASYRRLPIMAVCVAALLAAVGNGGEISLGHWVAAQEIVERWRESLHEFYRQVFIPEDSVSRKTEDRVLKFITAESRKKRWVSEAQLRRQTGLSSREIAHILNENDGKAIIACYVPHPKHPSNPTRKWGLIGTELPINASLADL
jgi:hypothetical protein